MTPPSLSWKHAAQNFPCQILLRAWREPSPDIYEYR